MIQVMGLYMNRYKKLMKLCLDFIVSLFLKTKFISEKILQVFKLNFMNKVNTMKKIFFSSFLCGLFLTITTLFGVEKIYISNGYLNYCLSPDVANSAVVFYSLDIRDGEWKQSYLPMTIVPEIYTKYDRNKQIIKFPLAWYMNRKELFVVFHDLESDAMGRVIFWLFSTDKPHDFDFLSSFKAYEYQNNIMKYKGHYFAWDGRGDCKHIQGISSDPFALNRLTNNSKIWYDFADKNIIARFPGLNDKRVETWMPSENPPYYKWILYAIEDDKMIVIQDDKLKGFTPLSSVSVKGKKVYADNGERINFPNDIDSIIWGIDNNSTPSIVLLSQSDEIKISKKNCPKLPKLILANEDSDYVMFIFDRKIDSLNVQGSLQEIKDMLEKRHLLHQYPPRPKKATVETTEDVQHNAEEPSDEPSPEEIERRRAEYLANQPKDNIFTEDEFKTLFPKVEYDNVADLYERGMAYDWDEKYSDAMKCFEQDSSLKSKFMLAMYYKTGSPEITKDSVKANVIFKEIIGDVSNKSAPTPEMLCIAGRACMEFISTDFSERQEFQNNAEKLFKESIKQGYATAAFYPQYCIKDNGKFQPQELIEIANKNNCLDAEVLAAGLALLMNPDFMNYRNKQENLLTIKKGIQAHIPLAEYILGELFYLDAANPDLALKPNRELALFWMKRAANHGEAEAIELLRQNPTLRPFNR